MRNASAVMIDDYLATLRRALHGVPAPERDEIVEEIRSHVFGRVEATGSDAEDVVGRVLQAVGEPEELASQYRSEALVRRAARSWSPWLLLSATARRARTGAVGFAALLLAVLGYGSSLVCYVCAMLKPVFPSRIGVWLTPEHDVTVGYFSGRLPSELMGFSAGPHGLNVLGTFGPTNGPVQELLGPWLTPAGIVAGLLCALATTWVLRSLFRRSGRRGRTAPRLAPA